MKQREIELAIEELLLRDMPPAQRQQIAATVEQELARLLREQGLPPSLSQGGHIPQVDIGTLDLAAHARAETIGLEVARNVYRHLWHNQAPEGTTEQA